MNRRELGKTGISVTEVGLGCEHLQGLAKADVVRTVHAALDAGMNILDVFMSEPQVRTDIGEALAGRRGDAVLQGHIGAIWENGQYGRSRDIHKTQSAFEDLLARLGTDYIDLGMLHFVDDLDDLRVITEGPVLEYAAKLKAQGRIRAVGLSSHNPVVAKKAVEDGVIDVLLFSLNPAFDLLPGDVMIDDLFKGETFKDGGLQGISPARASLYESCLKQGVGITVMKALGAGILLNGKLSPLGRAMTAFQLMRYALTRPAVSSVLIGCRTPGEVAKAAAYENAAEAETDYAPALDGLRAFPSQGRCMYCNHCLPCPQKIDIAAVNQYLDLAGDAPADTVRRHYLSLQSHGSDCVACGACQERCPFGVAVIERMRRAAEVFGR